MRSRSDRATKLADPGALVFQSAFLAAAPRTRLLRRRADALKCRVRVLDAAFAAVCGGGCGRDPAPLRPRSFRCSSSSSAVYFRQDLPSPLPPQSACDCYTIPGSLSSSGAPVRPSNRAALCARRNSLAVLCVASLLALACQIIRFFYEGSFLVDLAIVTCGTGSMGFTAWFVEWRSRSLCLALPRSS